MARFGIATLFEDVPDGHEFTDANTPLHLTHVDVCEVNLDPSEFVSRLRDHLANTRAFEIIPTQDTFFGPGENIPVTLVALNPALETFHKRLISFLVSIGAMLDNPQFHDEFYKPHISIHGQRRVLLGKPLSVHSVYIGNKRRDIQNPPSRIIATIPLG